jgi:hypothetical protein
VPVSLTIVRANADHTAYTTGIGAAHMDFEPIALCGPEQDIYLLFGVCENIEGLRRIGGFDRLVASVSQNIYGEGAHYRLVFDHQNANTHGPGKRYQKVDLDALRFS